MAASIESERERAIERDSESFLDPGELCGRIASAPDSSTMVFHRDAMSPTEYAAVLAPGVEAFANRSGRSDGRPDELLHGISSALSLFAVVPRPPSPSQRARARAAIRVFVSGGRSKAAR